VELFQDQCGKLKGEFGKDNENKRGAVKKQVRIKGKGEGVKQGHSLNLKTPFHLGLNNVGLYRG